MNTHHQGPSRTGVACSRPWLAASFCWAADCCGNQRPSRPTRQFAFLPLPDLPATGPSPQRAIFAGGCFWGVQGVFQHVKGVQRAVSGYSGGAASTPPMSWSAAAIPDHAESVEVTFDPSQVSYGQLLQIFFSVVHDPTQLNRQGRTPARSTARPFSRPARPSSRQHRPMSRSLTRHTCIRSPSSPASRTRPASIRPSSTTRTS
jgi:hypothetical protein